MFVTENIPIDDVAGVGVWHMNGIGCTSQYQMETIVGKKLSTLHIDTELCLCIVVKTLTDKTII